jgi:hypothetical protein
MTSEFARVAKADKRVREICDGYHKSFEIATSDQMSLVQRFRVVQAADLADDGEFARLV